MVCAEAIETGPRFHHTISGYFRGHALHFAFKDVMLPLAYETCIALFLGLLFLLISHGVEVVQSPSITSVELSVLRIPFWLLVVGLNGLVRTPRAVSNFHFNGGSFIGLNIFIQPI